MQTEFCRKMATWKTCESNSTIDFKCGRRIGHYPLLCSLSSMSTSKPHFTLKKEAVRSSDTLFYLITFESSLQ